MPDPTPPISPAARQTGLAFILRAFSSRNYRLFFSGQLLSLVGTWLSTIASSWLINRITDDPQQSPRVLGFVNFAALMPAFLLAPFAGVMVDRWRKHRIILCTQFLSMLQSFALAALAFTATSAGAKPPPETVAFIIYWMIGLSMFQGLVNAFDVPARQAFVVKLVDKREDLPNAIALNSTMFNGARFIGPAIAGLLIWKVGEAWCYTIDAFSYLAVLVALLLMRGNEEDRPATHRKIWVEFREGLSCASRFAPIRSIILLLAVVSFSTTAITILMPRFATEVLKGDARTQGLLTSAIAAGALIGAVRLAARRTVVGLVGHMPWVTLALGLGMITFGLSAYKPLSLLGLLFVGFGTMTQMAAGNTLLQTLVDDRMRGRVMSLFTMAFMGMMPLGSLAAGQLASHIGPARTVAAAGALSILAGLLFATRVNAIRRQVRPIYIERGILPTDPAPAPAA